MFKSKKQTEYNPMIPIRWKISIIKCKLKCFYVDKLLNGYVQLQVTLHLKSGMLD